MRGTRWLPSRLGIFPDEVALHDSGALTAEHEMRPRGRAELSSTGRNGPTAAKWSKLRAC